MLKTTMTAGKNPRSVIVDVANKSFYCLDSCTGDQAGRILTLAPTELGTIEEQATISTAGREPYYFVHINRSIYVLNHDCYTVYQAPTVSKSSRRRRRSSLAPVQEDTVAESLEELYKISRNMTTVKSSTEDPSNALQNLRSYINSETSSEIIETRQVVNYKDEPLLKLLPFANSKLIIGLKKSALKSYTIDENGGLLPASSMVLSEAIDFDIDDFIYVLQERSVLKIDLKDNKFSILQEHKIDIPDPYALKASDEIIIAGKGIILRLNLASGQTDRLKIDSTSILVSRDGRLLFVADASEGGLTMYTIAGVKLGSCKLQNAAQIAHMS